MDEAGLYLIEEDQRRVNSEQENGDTAISGITALPATQMTRVFVLSYKNKPVMPCSPRKARVLLKAGKATDIVGLCFVI
jgi:hypothetical protein